MNFASYAILLVFALSFTGCSTEEPFEQQIDEDQVLTVDSVVSNLIERTAYNDGSHDNIIDGSSCFDIRFPYTVMINELEFTIASEDDLELIEELFDAIGQGIEQDVDILDIIFPITITLADYTDITINTLADLEEIAEQCIEGGGDGDIECIDFVYPITLFTFDTNREQTDNVIVKNDKELILFFNKLTEGNLVSIDFPISLQLFDGVEIEVNNNRELADAIENGIEICDEDDDDDFNDDDFTKERLDQLLLECPWLIEEVQRDEIDQTDQFFNHLMIYAEDGVVIIEDLEGNVFMGEWITEITDDGAFVTLIFDFAVDFNLKWRVFEIGEDRIKFYVKDGNRIVVEQSCDNNKSEESKEK